MKPVLTFVLLAGLTAFLAFNTFQQKPVDAVAEAVNPAGIPIPTQVYEHMQEEEASKEKKKLYQDLIHGNNPDDPGSHLDWRAINEANFTEIYAWRTQMRSQKTPEIFAGGELEAEWFERGSSNNAGNVRVTDYDPATDAVYAVSDGGTLWKGSIDGITWTPLNEDLQFGGEVLEVFDLPGGGFRIVAARGHSLYYSDDEGANWSQSTGFTSTPDYGTAIDLVELNDAAQTLVYLYQGYNFGISDWETRLAYSTNNGQTFTFVTALNSPESGFVSMTSPYNSATAYIIDGDDDTYKFEGTTLTPLSTGLGLGGSSSCHITANAGADTTIYVLLDDEDLYVSTDNAVTFTYVAALPVPAWGVGIEVSIDDPATLYFGEVELYRSYDGGLNWDLVSNWWEYYGDVANKIHADMMSIRPFKDGSGNEFTLVPNHGGISISYDNLQTLQNIGINDLNVGQFYDVITSPINSDYIFGGTQDQGFQRTSDGNSSNTAYFEQVISGDYGHLQFSRNGLGLWIQYPGADFSYYPNALTDASESFWYNIEGADMPNYNWIVPTAPSPDPSKDWILVGGGDDAGGPGSYLIRLENSGGFGSTLVFPFDFRAASGANISAIETTPLDENKWYVATENGHFFHSEDAGQNWSETFAFTGPENDFIYSSDIYASRLIPGLVFMAGSGYSTDPVYMSTDGGLDFTSISSALPQTMVHDICMDPSEKYLFAATDAGPYVYVMATDEWYSLLGLSAPVQEYLSVEFVPDQYIVRFATWGRGIWDFKMTTVAGEESTLAENTDPVYPNPSPNGDVTISADKPSVLLVYDVQGREVMRSLLTPGSNLLHLGFLKSGSYVFVIAGEDKRIIRHKWIRE
jgi:photosystem II stability/assembly factor-like uncharacterized protein